MKSLNIFVLTTIVLFAFSCAKEKTVKVSGRVIDSSSNNPIEGAEVELYCKVYESFNFAGSGDQRTGEEVTYTDENGNFNMRLVAVCEGASVIVRMQGYKSNGINDYEHKIDLEQENFLEIKMEPCDSSNINECF